MIDSRRIPTFLIFYAVCSISSVMFIANIINTIYSYLHILLNLDINLTTSYPYRL